MEMKSAKLVYFSPTGTTGAVVQALAKGINPDTVEMIDITMPAARKQSLQTTEDELLVVGIPVYRGRVPALVTDWLNTIQARKTPAVCIVLYGNRDYENALIELKDILTSRGCIPVAGGAYIGEHSFSEADVPTAQGRPHDDDLKHAEEFGRRVREKLHTIASIDQMSVVDVPGAFPYEGSTELLGVDFIAVAEDCPQCGTCAEVCPVDAIDAQDSRMIDREKCISCCACIKKCPQNARTIKPGRVKDIQKMLNTRCSEPKSPEYFL